jgi:hypothetical protein
MVTTPVKAGSVEFARAMSRALRGIEDAPEGMVEAARMVTDRVAAARLGFSVDMLRRDRRTGKLGVPFVRIGEGKRCLIRYDLDDLDRWIAERKQVGKAEPWVVEQVDEPPAAPEPEEPVARATSTPRRHYRSPWEELAAAAMDKPEEDPFAVGRPGPRRTPGGYFNG